MVGTEIGGWAGPIGKGSEATVRVLRERCHGGQECRGLDQPSAGQYDCAEEQGQASFLKRRPRAGRQQQSQLQSTSSSGVPATLDL